MRKRPIKPNASMGVTCIAGWENKEVEDFLGNTEKRLKELAKKHNLEIDLFVRVTTL